MKLDIDAIDIPDSRARRQHDPAHIARVAASMASPVGQIDPIHVIPNGNRYTLVKGGARILAARKLGWGSIEAIKLPPSRENLVGAHHVAATEVRAPLSSVEKWKAMVLLQEAGQTLPQAAAVLGIEERQARQLDKLGRLHPIIIEALEGANRYRMPPWEQLATIAQAPLDVQERAILAEKKRNDDCVNWWNVAKACKSSREVMHKADAIFDTEVGVPIWIEDIFAEPGSREQWKTYDTKAFLAAQAEALLAEAVARRKKKQDAQVVEWDERKTGMRVPAGLQAVGYGADPDKPKKGQIVLMAVRPDGRIERALYIDVKAEKAAAKQRAKEDKAKLKAPAGKRAATAPDDEGDEQDLPPRPVADISPVTKAGRDAIAAAKRAALVKSLDIWEAESQLRPDADVFRDLCIELILAMHAENVTIGGYSDSSFNPSHHHKAGADLMRRLVNPAGHVILDDQAIVAAGFEALRRTLKFGAVSRPANSYGNNPDSGAPADWIGHFHRAGDLLERFDAEPFLATVNADTLRAAVESIGEKPAKTAKAMRAQLVGKAPAWRPPGALFGAPGPKPKAEPIDQPGDEDGMEDAA